MSGQSAEEVAGDRSSPRAVWERSVPSADGVWDFGFAGGALMWEVGASLPRAAVTRLLAVAEG